MAQAIDRPSIAGLERRDGVVQSPPSSLSPWTRRIVADEASLTDVPAHDRGRIAREVKTYADHFPNIGDSRIVRRLRDELDQAEVCLNEY